MQWLRNGVVIQLAGSSDYSTHGRLDCLDTPCAGCALSNAPWRCLWDSIRLLEECYKKVVYV